MGVEVTLSSGSCWVASAPAEGSTSAEVRIVLPDSAVRVGSASCALVLLEADRSLFVVAVSGTVELQRGGASRPLAPGTIVLVPHGGEPQVDHADSGEIAADPLVAANSP
ncbi:MAG: hypothetical protein ACR2MB_14280 [Acidimicrobiales bacterium]